MFDYYIVLVINNNFLSYMQVQWTPLHCAANNGHTDSVALLVANGADVNSKNKVSCLIINHIV